MTDANPTQRLSPNRVAMLIRRCYARSIPGTRLPGQAELARYFNCSEWAVRKALDALLHAGVLEQRERQGTFLTCALRENVPREVRVLTADNVPHNRQQTVLAGIDDACRSHGAAMTVHVLPSASPTFDMLAGLSDGRPVDVGWIMVFRDSPSAEAMRNLLTHGIRFVLVDDVPGPFRINLITRDLRGTILQVTERLIQLGHRRIALAAIIDPLESVDEERIRGFEAAYERHGMGVDPTLIVRTRGERRDCAPLLTPLLTPPDRPTAIVGVDQYSGCAAIKACDLLGLRVPVDVSVISSGLHPHFEPAELKRLTCLDEGSPRDMGRVAVDLILNQDEGANPATIWMQAKLVERGSVCPPQSPVA
ncbi:MAG: substrate-binding domain-containing protein [Phycisphaerae bacterium]|nr:substrate-binding domain-containing protein [Phycisphaerae bacterium]